MHRYIALAVCCATLTACPGKTDPSGSPYPDLEVTGTILSIRGEPVPDAVVTLANAYDSTTAMTETSGVFTVVMDGSDDASSFRVTHPHYRPWSGTASLTESPQDLGSRSIISKEEILFSTVDGDLYMIRADGQGDLIQLTDTAGNETSPRRSESGHVVRWANTTDSQVVEASWDGSNAQVISSVDEGDILTGLAWGERGTFVARTSAVSAEPEIVILEDLPGETFFYNWTGSYPDESPPAFGSIGPEPIDGNMLCFSGYVADYQQTGESRSGLFTAFPYFTDDFLRPVHIEGTVGTDLYPRWSDLNADSSLDLAFVRDYEIYWSHVTSDEEQNVYSTPALLYGGDADAINVNQIAWAPSIEGEPARIAFSVNAFSSGSPLAERGDLVVVEVDLGTGTVISVPQVIYQGSAPESPGLAIAVDWR